MSAKREFTGVFIPAHIWESKDLTPAEKMMLGEIDALSKTRGYCDASRQHFADWLHCTPQNITYMWGKLEDMGFIRLEKIPGERNKIYMVPERFYIQEGVNPIYGGGKSHLRGGVNPIYGGGKRDLPEIKEKYKIEIKDESITETHVSEFATQQKTEVETSTPQSEKKSKQRAPGGCTGAGVAPGDEMQIAIEAIQYLNAKARRSFRTTTGNTKGVLARVKEGFTLEQIKKMIDYKCREWLQRPEMTEYLNPITLFRDSNFERYYQAAEHCTTIGPTHNPVAGPATYQRLQYTSPVPNEVQAF